MRLTITVAGREVFTIEARRREEELPAEECDRQHSAFQFGFASAVTQPDQPE